MGGKWLELLKEVAPEREPGGGHSGCPRQPAMAQFAAVEATAPSLGCELSPVDVQDPAEIERAIEAFALGRMEA